MGWRKQNLGPIGVDVGARCVRVVQLREHAGGYAVHAAGVTNLASGKEREMGEQQSAITRVLTQHRFSGKRVAICLPNAAVQTKTMRLPRMPEEELLVAGELEARDRFSDMRDAMIRILPAGLVGRVGAEQYEVIVLATRPDAVDARLKLFTPLGLTVTHIEPATQAFLRPFARFLERSADAESGNAFVDLGARGSRIVIARGSDVVFIKNCPVGGETLDRAVAEVLSIPIEQAVVLRREILMSDTDDPRAEQAFEAMGGALDQLGKEIGLCLRYFAVTFRGQRPERVIGGGGEFVHPWVAERLTQATQIPVLMGDALRGIAHEKLGPEEGPISEWCTAIGLALHGHRQVSKVLDAAHDGDRAREASVA